MPDATASEWESAIADAIGVIRAEVGEFRPDIMVSLGSGLSDAVSPADVYASIPYARIPGFKLPSVAGHTGQLLFGSWGARSVMIFQGRLHRYEGHTWETITMPVRLAAGLGVPLCVFTNMSGAVNTKLKPGALVAIADHMNFMGSNPLVGVTANDPTMMFPDMGEAYSPRLRRLLDEAARMLGVPLTHGIYVGVSGPNYETPAEVRALALLGADVVGMSTVGEVLVARQLGIECCAISCVANMAAGISNAPIRHLDVLESARATSVRLAGLLDTFIRML